MTEFDVGVENLTFLVGKVVGLFGGEFVGFGVDINVGLLDG